jgi:hypothetical protein
MPPVLPSDVGAISGPMTRKEGTEAGKVSELSAAN